MSDESVGLGDAQYYGRWYGQRNPDFYRGILCEIVRCGQPGNLLELGCGPGLILDLAIQWGIDAVGCDGSDAAVALAVERVSQARVKKCLLSGKLPYQSESYDNVLMNQVIEHLPEAVFKNCLRECNRVLKKGGMIFIFSPSRVNREEVVKDPTHCNPLLPSELRSWLKTSGFDVIHEPNAFHPAILRIFVAIERKLFRTIHFVDRLSRTANAYARKH